MEGVPCIIGGLTKLCGEFCNFQAYCVFSKYNADRLNGWGEDFTWKTLPTVLLLKSLIQNTYILTAQLYRI